MAKQVSTSPQTFQAFRTIMDANFTELYNSFYQSLSEKTASYTLALLDATNMQKLNHASTPIVVTVPKNSVIAFPIGVEITFIQYGVAQCSFIPVDGTVTIRSVESALKISAQYGTVTLKKIATDEWLLLGALTA